MAEVTLQVSADFYNGQQFHRPNTNYFGYWPWGDEQDIAIHTVQRDSRSRERPNQRDGG